MSKTIRPIPGHTYSKPSINPNIRVGKGPALSKEHLTLLSTIQNKLNRAAKSRDGKEARFLLSDAYAILRRLNTFL